MSLFGTSPDAAGRKEPTAPASRPAAKSLFDDHQRSASHASDWLFADDGAANGDSPWTMPTPKKAARSELIRNLLPPADVPDSYVDAFDAIVASGERAGGNVSNAAVKKLLDSAELPADERGRLVGLVAPEGAANGLERGAFNVLLALVGLAKEGEDASLDGVDERRKNLPVPQIPYLDSLHASAADGAGPATPTASSPAQSKRTSSQTTPPRPGAPGKPLPHDSLTDPEMDPWASPADGPKAATRAVHNAQTPAPADGGSTAARPLVGNRHGGSALRTTSTFTTHGADADSDGGGSGGGGGGGKGSGDAPSGGMGAGWGAMGNEGFSNGMPAGLEGGGFGAPGSSDGDPSRPGRPGGAALRGMTQGGQEVITVTVLPEKEGMFMFQHRNYEVKSARRGSAVVRRYSDFVWLLDCLHKRYPFRQLPLLPPKTLALVNGRHLSADVAFIEKRRRGLVRFANALVRHPVLREEQLVTMFLTVPTELSVWRKQATISVQEEFTGKALPPGLEDSLPVNLAETFDAVRSGVRRSADNYIQLCSLAERLAKRQQGMASDEQRFAQSLRHLTEESANTYATDNNDVPLLNEGLGATAKHLDTSRGLREDEARAWDEGVLEDLKRQRDCLVSVRDMFDRRDRYARNNIPQLERRIEVNENKLAAIRVKPEGTARPGEQEKVEQAILNDKQSIVDQHARGVFIRECLRDELQAFQQSQYQVSRLHQDWSQELVKYAELQADNWRALSEQVEHMPLGE